VSVPAIYNGNRENKISPLHIEQGKKSASVVLSNSHLAAETPANQRLDYTRTCMPDSGKKIVAGSG
jgi:hypothetical protein